MVTMMNLGIAYKELGKLKDKVNGIYNFSLALQSLNKAQEIFSPDFNPLIWFEVQYNLSETYYLLEKEHESERILVETQKYLFP